MKANKRNIILISFLILNLSGCYLQQIKRPGNYRDYLYPSYGTQNKTKTNKARKSIAKSKKTQVQKKKKHVSRKTNKTKSKNTLNSVKNNSGKVMNDAIDSYRRFRYKSCVALLENISDAAMSLDKKSFIHSLKGASYYYLRNSDKARNEFKKSKSL